MKMPGILDGDLVARASTPEVRNRQIVVARLDNEVTVKPIGKKAPSWWRLLQIPISPIRVDLKEQHDYRRGVVGVLRRGKDVDAA